MDYLRSEDEDVAALKRWWKENGNSLLIGVGLALAAIFGWKAYQQHEKEQKEQASILYDKLTQAVASQQGAAAENAEANVVYLAGELKDKFPDSIYAHYASLFEAKELVSDEKYAEAEAVLAEVKAKSDDDALNAVINTRLARVKAALQEYDAAVSYLNTGKDDPFYVSYEELKGDILKMKGSRAEAKAAYQNALDQAKVLNQPTQILEIKINDLADA
ncbi:YfgM family protein [Hahella ganghwensis]|uniref:YfgM family protein n=1 Tax=Hahella ganghwensis TaxID=286420 RepID=UPI00036E097F|nr:tetratricopeptide repeat protein [Hahella ganghwensis]